MGTSPATLPPVKAICSLLQSNVIFVLDHNQTSFLCSSGSFCAAHSHSSGNLLEESATSCFLLLLFFLLKLMTCFVCEQFNIVTDIF